MGLLPGRLSPALAAGLTRRGTWLPCARAAEELAYFWRARVSASTARRQTEAAGAADVAVQTAAVEALEQGAGAPPAGPARQFLSADGAMVPLVGGAWAAVKTRAVGTLQAPVREADGWRVHTTARSYFSRLAAHEDFARLARVETHRRGVATAGTVVAVTDGSPWRQGFIDYHRPDAVRVLACPHAVEHLTAAAQATFGAGGARAADGVAGQAHTLKHGDPTGVLLALLDLPVRAATDPPAAAAARRATLRYLAARWAAIQYAQFQAPGYPRGDGAIESADKLVPEARLKGSGMPWAPASIDPLVARRTVAGNDRWAEAWPQLATRRRTQQRARRRARQQARRAGAAAPAACPPPPAPPPPAQPPARRATAIPALPPERTGRPHPWSFQARVDARSLPPTTHARL
ncbi:MAG TPA: hypothetical protein VFW96_20725 [Thermomicrobiales bacterium]|nr:hypothetical protein [Thermomicrobiales bacterium]